MRILVDSFSSVGKISYQVIPWAGQYGWGLISGLLKEIRTVELGLPRNWEVFLFPTEGTSEQNMVDGRDCVSSLNLKPVILAFFTDFPLGSPIS